jgi:hypothetical protein
VPEGPPLVQAPDDRGPTTAAILVILGVGASLAVLGYVGIYATQSARMDQYVEGFILSICPVCEQGHLFLGERRYRTLGIPRARRVVRCDHCRSVLRQVGRQRWRYAVDSAESPDLFRELNGRVVTERELVEISPEYGPARPEYIEDDEVG